MLLNIRLIDALYDAHRLACRLQRKEIANLLLEAIELESGCNADFAIKLESAKDRNQEAFEEK